MQVKLNLSNLFLKRKAKGLTQKELSELTGISIKKIQKAEKEDVMLSDLIKIAKALGTSEYKLYECEIIEE